MADFSKTELEIQNVKNPTDNTVVLQDPTTPSYKAEVTSSGELKVFQTGGSAGQLVEDGQAALVDDVGRICVGYDGTNYQFVSVNSSGRLQVDVISGGTSGQQVEDGQVFSSGDVGNISVGYDGTNYQFLSVDSDGQLQVDVLSLPNVVLASQASPFTDDINVSLDGEQVDISDRANRDLGQVDIVDIAAQAWPFNTDAAITLDGEQIDISDRAGRDLGKVDIAAFDVSLPTGDNTIGRVKLTDGTDVADITDDSGTKRLEVWAKIAAGGASQDVHPVDTNGVDLDVALDTLRPANTRALLISGLDDTDYIRVPTVTPDTEDGRNRVEVSGKFTLTPPEPPAATTPVTIDGGNPLDLSGTDTEDWIIPNGETFTFTQLIAGAEGDPTEKGSKVEVRYVDSSSVEHLISRVYITGFTTEIYPQTSQARDGTALTGDGVTTAIRIYREHFGGGTRELDAVVRGYY